MTAGHKWLLVVLTAATALIAALPEIIKQLATAGVVVPPWVVTVSVVGPMLLTVLAGKTVDPKGAQQNQS